MIYVGLDAHYSQSTYCVLDCNGKKLFTKTVKGHRSTVVEELKKVKKEANNQKMAVCFEASDSYGGLNDALEKVAERVVVAHPSQLRLIFRAKKKNDKVDAHKLAQLLFMDMVPEVYVPDQNIREWRSMIEFRSRQVEKRTACKNRIRAFIRECGIKAPRGLWSAKGQAWLRQLDCLSDLGRIKVEMMLEDLDQSEKRIQATEKVLNRIARKHRGVRLLKTIPGIGPRTSEALVAYIADPSRFSRTDKIGSYLGLVPCQDQSAERNRFGHITREGPSTLRRLLVEASWVSVRKSETVGGFFERVTHGDKERRKTAIVATAHYLARVSLSMLKSGEAWREAG